MNQCKNNNNDDLLVRSDNDYQCNIVKQSWLTRSNSTERLTTEELS